MSLKELLKEIEDDVTKEEEYLFNIKSPTASHQQILEILYELPILVQPTLKWLQAKKMKLAGVQLMTLYSTEELKQMFTPEEWEIFKTIHNIRE